MKIRTGKCVRDKDICIFSLEMWRATDIVLSNKSMQDELFDRAFAAAGVSRGAPLYDAEVKLSPADWKFHVTVFRYKWVEITE